MPKPSATIDACSKNFESALLSAEYGCVTASPKIIPAHKAIGGEINPVADKISKMKKIIFGFISAESQVFESRAIAISLVCASVQKRFSPSSACSHCTPCHSHGIAQASSCSRSCSFLN